MRGYRGKGVGEGVQTPPPLLENENLLLNFHVYIVKLLQIFLGQPPPPENTIIPKKISESAHEAT